jgi:hypothetical protein
VGYSRWAKVEQTQSKPPKKRRRRWLIVAFVLVLVSTVSWWYWPRGDARFVGKWRIDWDCNYAKPKEMLVLKSNGIGFLEGNPSKEVFRWRVDRNRLILGEGVSWDGHWAASKLKDWCHLFTGHYPWLYAQEYEITEITADRIRYNFGDDECRGKSLNRIPE